MSKFKYGGRSDETVKSRQQQSGDFDSFLSDKAPKLKIPEGHMSLRIMPYSWDKKLWGDNWALTVYIHRGVGPDNSSYLCPASMAKHYPKWKHAEDDWCPICDAYAQEEDEKAKKKLRAQSQRLAFVINRKDEKAGPQIWRLGVKIETDLQMRSEDQKTGEMLLIDDPEQGYDISFRRVGTTMENTEYKAVDIDRSPSPLSEKESRQEAWLDFISESPIPDLLIFHDGKYLEKIFMGTAGSKKDKDEEEEEDDRPTRGKRAKAEEEDDDDDRSSRRRKPKEDEDDDDDDRSSGRRSRKAEADDDDADTRRRPKKPKDDDDDDDQPRKRKPKEDEDDDGDDRPKRRKPKEDEDDDDDRTTRRKPARDDDDDDDDRSTRKKKKADDDDDDDDRKPKRGRRNEEEEEDDDRPSRAGSAERRKPRSGGASSADRDRTDDDDDDRSSRRKKKPADDDDDEIPFDKGKRRAPAKDDDDDDDKEPPTARARKALEKMKGKARD